MAQQFPTVSTGDEAMTDALLAQHPQRAALTTAAVLAILLAAGCSAGVSPGAGGGVRPKHAAAAAVPVSSPSRGQPRFLITAVDGRGYVRSSVTGRLIARISPPVPGFVIDGIAVVPGDRAFYLAGQLPMTLPHMKIEFFKFALSAHGLPGPAQRLPGRPVITQLPAASNGLTVLPLALSPDSRQLAWASPELFSPAYAARHAATITVRNVATGRERTWSVWPAGDTEFDSVSWAASNKLGFFATLGNAAVSGKAVVRRRGSHVAVFMLLNTTAAGSSLTADSRLVAYGTAVRPPAEGDRQLPGSSGGLIGPDGRSAYLLTSSQPADGRPGAARLVRVSLASGAITKVLLSRGPQTYQGDPSAIDGSHLLIFLGPRRAPTHRGSFACGHMTEVTLPAGVVTDLPVPLYCDEVAPPPLVEAGW
jgi:hypothetical protein